MAHFICEIQGSRGEASRLGTAKSGIYSHARGWDAGVKVIGEVDAEGNDVFHVYATSGSRGSRPAQLIAVVDENGIRTETA